MTLCRFSVFLKDKNLFQSDNPDARPVFRPLKRATQENCSNVWFFTSYFSRLVLILSVFAISVVRQLWFHVWYVVVLFLTFTSLSMSYMSICLLWKSWTIKERDELTSFSCKNWILENWLHWNARIHNLDLREIVKTVLVFLRFTYYCILNLPETEKQSKKWMVTGLWEIFFDQFQDLRHCK